MNSENLLIRLNKLEAWLHTAPKKPHLLPVRVAGYIALFLALMVSNFVAVVRWPIAAVFRLFSRSQKNVADFAEDKPLEVDEKILTAFLSKPGLVLVDFWAEWCGPCIMMHKSMEKLATSHGERCTITKVNTVSHAKLATKYSVRGLPTLILFRNGQEIKRFAGALSYSELVEFIGVG